MVVLPALRPRARGHRPDLHGERRADRGVEPADRGARDAQGRPLERRRDRVALLRGRPGTDADPRAPRGNGSRGQGEGQAEQLSPMRSAYARVVTEITLRAGKYEATFLPDAAMLCASLRHGDDEYVAWPRTHRRVPRRARDRDPARAPVGQPARGRELPRRRRRRLARGPHAPPRSQRPADPRQPLRRSVRGAADERHAGRRDASTTARTPTSCARSRSRTSSPSTRACTPRVASTSSPRSTPTVGPRRADLVRLASVRPTPGRAPRRMGAALARVRARRGRRPPHPDRHAHAAAPRSASPSPRARSTTTTRSAPTARSRSPAARDANRRTLTLQFDPAYPFAQLFVPPAGELVAIEPMTAEIDALGRGTTPVVEPGDRFLAAFNLAVTTS